MVKLPKLSKTPEQVAQKTMTHANVRTDWAGHWLLLKEMLAVMLKHPYLLMFAILPNIILPAIEPIKAWIGKEVIDKISKGENVFTLVQLLDYAPLLIGLFFGFTLLKLAEKLSNRLLDDRLFIELQRIWYQRRGEGSVGSQVASAMNDCESARKVLDLFQKEIWAVLIGLPAVLIWQFNLDKHMLPALVMASFLPFLAALLFGSLIQRYSHIILRLVTDIGGAIADGDETKLHQNQELFFRNRFVFELVKQFSELTAEFAYWISLLLLLVLSISGILPLLPDTLTASEIGVFLINLKLISSPLTEIAKVYNKIREGWPAVERTLYPCGKS